jgi:hypothetical protein
MNEHGRMKTRWILTKFKDPDGRVAELLRSGRKVEDVAALFPDRFEGTSPIEGNCLLNEGIDYLLDTITGIEAAPVLWDSANSRVGVGADNTAAVPAQSGLLDAGAEYAAMDATYPSRTGEAITWRGTFGDGDAEFAWEEFCVDNGAVSGKTLNRKAESKGTKAAGESWSLAVEITLS